MHMQGPAGPSPSLGWSLWPFRITGCLVLGEAQTLPLHSSAEMEAESPQPMALGRLPGVCPPTSHCTVAVLQTQHELKDSISRNLCCWIGLPGAAMLTPAEHHLHKQPRHWGEG